MVNGSPPDLKSKWVGEPDYIKCLPKSRGETTRTQRSREEQPYICLRLAGLLYSAALTCPCPHLSNDHTIKWLWWWRSYKGNTKIPISLLTISDISEMYPLFVCWRLIFTSEALKSKIFPVAILSVAAFIVIAIIACTAKKAFDEQTWTAFAVLLVVTIQVLP